MLETRLPHLRVDLMISSVRELRAKGVVESQRVAEVPQPGAVRLCRPLTKFKILSDRKRERERERER